MRMVAIVNPISGASKQRKGLYVLLERLRAAGVQVECHRTRGPGDARCLARGAADRAELVIAVGGDGTVCETADGLAGTGVPMAVWPTGTENLVAKSLGFRAEPDLAMACLLRGRTLTMDLGVANGRSFMVVAGVGFDAEVVYRLTRVRVGHITHLSYAGPLWRTFWEHRWPTLLVTADGPDGPLQWEGRGMIFVGNMARYSLGLGVVRDAQPDDGLLDLSIMACRNQLQLIGHSLRTLCRTHIEHRSVCYRRITRLHVESPAPVPIQTDGEAAGWLPLDISVRAGAIRVRVPPAPGCE